MTYACPRGERWWLDPAVAFDPTSSWMRYTGDSPAGIACPRHRLFAHRRPNP